MAMHKPLLNKAIARHQAGEFEAALVLYKEIIASHPKVSDAHHLLGVVYLQTQQFVKAIASIQKAIHLNNRNAIYFSNLGIAQLDSGRQQEAVQSFSKALALNPSFAQASFNLGNAYADLHQYALAIEQYERAIALDNTAFAYHLNLANTYRELGDYSLAVNSYEKALELNQADLVGWLNKGLCLQRMQAPLQAIDCFQKVIKLDPNHWESHWTLGRLHINLSQWHEAIDHLTQAANGMSNKAELWHDLGIALDKVAISSQAVIAFEQALALNPNFEQAHNNLGSVRHGLQQYPEALHHFEQALKVKSDYKAAHVNKAFTLLLNGHLTEGFQSYEHRNLLGEFQPLWLPADKPAWTGQHDIKGQKLLVYAEQGFGDTIQFARYLPLLKGLAPHMRLAVQKSLIPVFEGLDCLSQVVDLNADFNDFDCHVSLLSLPHILGTVMATIPQKPAPLHVAEAVALKWKSILGTKTKPRVGLVWSGSATHTNDANRSLPLQHMLAHLPAGLDYIALQKEVRQSDREDLRSSKIRHFETDIQDFQDTAAICQQLDLVISVDTSVAHLSASLQCPTWVLLPLVPDWRWFLDREDSPWYPSVRLFRQDRAGDWDQVMQSIHIALLQRFH
jgi:tetratricopeptide (TPR) repeat protein